MGSLVRSLVLSSVVLVLLTVWSVPDAAAQKPETATPGISKAKSATLANGSRLAVRGLATAPSTSSRAGEQRVVKVVSSKKDVQVQLAPESEWQPATEGLTLGEGARLKTGRRAECELVLGEPGTPDVFLTVNADTELTFTELIKQAGTNRHTQLDLTLGKIFAQTKGIDKDDKFEVTTPTSVAGVWGSKFQVHVKQARGGIQTTVSVYEAAAANFAKFDALGHIDATSLISIAPGQIATLSPTGVMRVTSFIPQEVEGAIGGVNMIDMGKEIAGDLDTTGGSNK